MISKIMVWCMFVCIGGMTMYRSGVLEYTERAFVAGLFRIRSSVQQSTLDSA